jgi:hypothetical protein
MVWMIWNLIFQMNHNTGFVGHNSHINHLLFNNIRNVIGELPSFLKSSIVFVGEKLIETKDRSRLILFTPNTNSVRGLSLDNLIWEEYDHIECESTYTEILQNITPAVTHSGGSIFMVGGYIKHHPALLKSEGWHQCKVPLFKGNVSTFSEGSKVVNERILQLGGLNTFLRVELG